MLAANPAATPPDAPLRVLILSHYYPPELGAPQTRLRETARELRRLGLEVRVLTGPPHYPDGHVRPGYHRWRGDHEQIDGVGVRRLPTWTRPNGGFLDRTIDQGSFAVAALAAVGSVRWAHVVLVESPPLFLGLTAALQRLVLGRPYLFHVADPWPDFPIAMGALDNPIARRVAYAIESVAYRQASLITTVTPGLVELVASKPAAVGKVRLLPNAVDTSRFDPGRKPSEARRMLGWTDDATHLVYAGSVGLAQGLGTLLEATRRLDRTDVVIHIVGEGFERRALADEAARTGIRQIRFEDPVGSDRIPTLLAAADGLLVLLRAGPMYDQALPTKLLEGLAAGRPLLVSAAGETARVVGSAEAGLVAPPEDAAGLATAIDRFASMGPTERAAMGAAARAIAVSEYDRAVIVARLADLLREAAGLGPAGRA